jgi:phosphate transport system substrate-binding protein
MSLLPLILAGLLAAAPAAEAEAPVEAGAEEQSPLPSGPLRLTGSTTVAPFSLTVASTVATDIVVDPNGTTAGLAALCAETRPAALAGASRAIRPAERKACEAAGVATLIEIDLGLDGIVLAQKEGAGALPLTPRDLYLAAAREVPISEGDCRLAPNRAGYWSDVRADLPERRITVLGPPPTSGTRDVLEALALKAGARALPCMLRLEREDPEAFEAAMRLRTDGAWSDAGEADGAVAFALTRLPHAIGVFGLAHALSQEGIEALPFAGVHPTAGTIADGRYALARPLYLYTTTGQLTRDPRVVEVVKTFRDPASTGPGGVLTRMGLVPTGEAARAKLIDTASGEETPLVLGR